MLALLRRPEGFTPVAICGAFLAGLLTAAAQGRLIPQTDENAAAHLFQILMPVALIVMLVFAGVWLPKRPRPALAVSTLQAALFAAVLAVVHSYRL